MSPTFAKFPFLTDTADCPPANRGNIGEVGKFLLISSRNLTVYVLKHET